MPTLKRQKADGTWEYLQLTGQDFDNHSARHENLGADVINLAGLQGESAELVSHKSETASETDDVHDLFSEGRVIEESDSNANGEYVRFADGTQICWHQYDFTFDNNIGKEEDWTYPAAFSVGVGFTWGISERTADEDYGKYLFSAQRGRSLTAAVLARHIDGTARTATVKSTLYAVGRWK